MKPRSPGKLRRLMVEAALGGSNKSCRKASRTIQSNGASQGTAPPFLDRLPGQSLQRWAREEAGNRDVAQWDPGRLANYPARSLKGMEAKRFAPVLFR